MTRKDYVFLVVMGIVFCMAYVYAFDSKLDLNGDNANYLRYARSIAAGHGYASPGVDGYTPVGHYPPAYSTFLAAFMALGIDNLVFFKVLNWLLLTASLCLFYLVAKRCTGNAPMAFVPLLLAVFCPELQHFAGIVMSEMLFVFFTALCLYACYGQSCWQGAFWRSPWFYVIIVSAAASYYTRTVGMALVLGVLAFYLFRLRWKEALLSLGGVVLLYVPWVVRNAVCGIESRYFGTIMTVNPWRPEEGQVASVGDLLEKMVHNFDETVIKGFKDLLFPFVQVDYSVSSSFLEVVGGMCIVALVFYGAWQLKAIRGAVVFYLVGQIGLFMLWHGGNGARYVVPLVPLLYLCFYTGLWVAVVRLCAKWSGWRLRWLPYVFLLTILPMLAPLQQRAKVAKTPYPPAYTNYFTMARELQQRVSPGTICCCRKPELFLYYAPQLRATNYKYTTRPDELIRDLLDKRVDFVVFEQLGYSSTFLYLYPAIEQYPEVFPVVWHLPNPDTYLLRFDKAKAEEVLSHVVEAGNR